MKQKARPVNLDPRFKFSPDLTFVKGHYFYIQRPTIKPYATGGSLNAATNRRFKLRARICHVEGRLKQKICRTNIGTLTRRLGKRASSSPAQYHCRNSPKFSLPVTELRYLLRKAWMPTPFFKRIGSSGRRGGVETLHNGCSPCPDRLPESYIRSPVLARSTSVNGRQNNTKPSYPSRSKSSVWVFGTPPFCSQSDFFLRILSQAYFRPQLTTRPEMATVTSTHKLIILWRDRKCKSDTLFTFPSWIHSDSFPPGLRNLFWKLEVLRRGLLASDSPVFPLSPLSESSVRHLLSLSRWKYNVSNFILIFYFSFHSLHSQNDGSIFKNLYLVKNILN